MITNQIQVFEPRKVYLHQLLGKINALENTRVSFLKSADELTNFNLANTKVLICSLSFFQSDSFTPFTVIKSIKEAYPLVNIIMCSEFFDQTTIFNCIASGAFNCLNYTQEDYLEDLAEYIHRINVLDTYNQSVEN